MLEPYAFAILAERIGDIKKKLAVQLAEARRWKQKMEEEHQLAGDFPEYVPFFGTLNEGLVTVAFCRFKITPSSPRHSTP